MILVTGGAGYIGSLVTKKLLDQGHRVLVVDNLSTGSPKNIDARASFVEIDIRDPKSLSSLFSENKIKTVIHFAALISVDESISKPSEYYETNFVGTLNVLSAMKEADVKNLVFSSTAAVYAETMLDFIDENAKLDPISPYGKSKLFAERAILDLQTSGFIRPTILRYFNVAGASDDLRSGPGKKSSHSLFKALAQSALTGHEFVVNGNDYNTPDGTPVRDYIHVEDLADLHVIATALQQTGIEGIFNCGYGSGYSVLEAAKAMTATSGKEIKMKIGTRRPGDLPRVIASSSKIRELFNWKPQHSDIYKISASALKWEQKNAPQSK